MTSRSDDGTARTVPWRPSATDGCRGDGSGRAECPDGRALPAASEQLTLRAESAVRMATLRMLFLAVCLAVAAQAPPGVPVIWPGKSSPTPQCWGRMQTTNLVSFLVGDSALWACA